MLKLTSQQPLGEVLQKAGLVYEAQLEVAIRDQHDYPDLRLGEILALRGWLKQETADFFAEDWFRLIEQAPQKPLGYYLRKAALLNDKQVKFILYKQKQVKLRFGAIAVLKGWITQTTLDFFLQNVSTAKYHTPAIITRRR